MRPEQVRWLWDIGFRRITHDLWTGGYPPSSNGSLIAPHNIQTVLDSGLPFVQDGYIVVDDRKGSGQGAWHVDRGYMSVLDLWHVLEQVWVDVEVSDVRFGGTTFPTVRSGVERVAQLGKRRAIYSRRGFWKELGDSADFGDCLFWLARYDGRPDPYAGFIPFPSCDRSNYAGKQYHNTTDADGLAVDLNTFIPEVLYPQTETEDDMFIGQFAKSIPWMQSFAVTVGKEGARKTLVANAAEYESLVAAGYPVRVMAVENLRRIISSPGTPDA